MFRKHCFFFTIPTSTSYVLNTNQKEIVDSFFNFLEEYFLDPLVKDLPEEKLKMAVNDIRLALDSNGEESTFKNYLAELYQDEFQVLQIPMLEIFQLTKGIIPFDHPLHSALDFRIYNVKKEASPENLKEKLAIGKYLSLLISEYLENRENGCVAKRGAPPRERFRDVPVPEIDSPTGPGLS